MNNNKRIPVVFSLLVLVFSPLTHSQDCRDNRELSTPTRAFSLHDNGTVTHHQTGLMWLRCPLNQRWDNRNQQCTGSSIPYDWELAMETASEHSFAGHKDWRLPSKEELLSIVETTCSHPAINLEVFPGTASSHFWTSSTSEYFDDHAWRVFFNHGVVHDESRRELSRVRLVRQP